MSYAILLSIGYPLSESVFDFKTDFSIMAFDFSKSNEFSNSLFIIMQLFLEGRR